MQGETILIKGMLTTIILKLLSDTDKMYGYEITKKVKQQSLGRFNLTEGALYPALHKLEASGLVTVSVEFTGRRQRKYYSLTKVGKKEYKYKMESFASFFNSINLLLNLKTSLT